VIKIEATNRSEHTTQLQWEEDFLASQIQCQSQTSFLKKRSTTKAAWLLLYSSEPFNSWSNHFMGWLANPHLHTRQIEAMQMMP
jgi:hypothetical protein